MLKFEQPCEQSSSKKVDKDPRLLASEYGLYTPEGARLLQEKVSRITSRDIIEFLSGRPEVYGLKHRESIMPVYSTPDFKFDSKLRQALESDNLTLEQGEAILRELEYSFDIAGKTPELKDSFLELDALRHYFKRKLQKIREKEEAGQKTELRKKIEKVEPLNEEEQALFDKVGRLLAEETESIEKSEREGRVGLRRFGPVFEAIKKISPSDKVFIRKLMALKQRVEDFIEKILKEKKTADRSLARAWAAREVFRELSPAENRALSEAAAEESARREAVSRKVSQGLTFKSDISVEAMFEVMMEQIQ